MRVGVITMDIFIVAAILVIAGAGAFALGEWITRRSSARWVKQARDRMRGK